MAAHAFAIATAWEEGGPGTVLSDDAELELGAFDPSLLEDSEVSDAESGLPDSFQEAASQTGAARTMAYSNLLGRYSVDMRGFSRLEQEGEMEFGRRMARAKLRMLKEIGRSPIAQASIIPVVEDILAGRVSLENICEILGAQRGTSEYLRIHAQTMKRISHIADAYRRQTALSENPDLTLDGEHSKRLRFTGPLRRARAELALAIRETPFRKEQWKIFIGAMKAAALPELQYNLKLIGDRQLEDERARNELVECNLRLVVDMAYRYQNRGLHLRDLVQEGNLGLIWAAEHYDYRRGWKFSTYATRIIKRAILQAIADQGRTIRVPLAEQTGRNKMMRVTEALEAELGRSPNEAEIARRMEVSVGRVETFQAPLPEHIPLETQVGKYAQNRVGDRLVDPTASRFFNEEDTNMEQETDLSLKILSPKEEKVIRMRFGIGYEREHTLEEVGQEFSVTRERIRQIEAKALRALRTNPRMLKIGSYKTASEIPEQESGQGARERRYVIGAKRTRQYADHAPS